MAPGHWTDELFLKHPEIFLAIHESAWAAGEEQSKRLKTLLDRFGVPPGGRILDAPCGIGRHATRLAGWGYRTVGIDFSPVYVARAVEIARREGMTDRTSYRVGDLRTLSNALAASEGPFDAALNLWTSIGYYDEDTDVHILHEYAKQVRPGGLFVLYIVNRDYVVRHFDPQGIETFGEIVHIEQRHLDLATSYMRNEWRFFRRNGDDLDHIVSLQIDHVIYSLHELRRLLTRAGWTFLEAFGGFNLDPPSTDSPTLLVVGRR